ncbi:hypothetical protein ABZ495_36100, partial [Kitasatospora sp. NPDC005748]
MSDAVLNVVIGLVTSVVSGGSVWAWKRVSAARVLHRKRALLGLRPGVPCVVILNGHWQMAAVTEHGDVYAIIELAMLAEESGCAFTLVAADAPELNGDRTELSIGGLGSNRRNVEYLARYLPGVTSAASDCVRLVVTGRPARPPGPRYLDAAAGVPDRRRGRQG